MKKKRNLIISSIILILGILCLTIVFLKPDIKNNTNKNNDNILNDTTKKFDIIISNFTVSKLEKNSLSLSFSINNNNETKYKSNNLYIKFYDNSNLLYTFEYPIDELDAYEIQTIESNVGFEFENITKYVFVIDDIEKELIPLDLSTTKSK